MTLRANWRPRKFLERLSRTYGLLRSVQCHFLLVGREDAGGAHEERHVGARGGAGPPAAASGEPLPLGPPRVASALQGEVPHIWFTSKGKSQWVSGTEEAQQTRPSHAAWTPRHSVTSSTGHQAWPAPKSLERGCVWNEAIFSAEDHILWAQLCLMYKTASSCVQRGWFCDLQMTHFGSGMRLELHTHTHTKCNHLLPQGLFVLLMAPPLAGKG